MGKTATAGKSYKPWTDEEYATLESMTDRTAREVGEALGRSAVSVSRVRQRLNHGWVRTQEHWAPSEDQVIIDAGPLMTAEDLADRLPGRTRQAVYDRRATLGVKVGHGHQSHPFVIGARPLLAKTCSKCGALLAATKFGWKAKRRIWSSWCKNCDAALTNDNRKPLTDTDRARHAMSNKKYQHKAHAVAKNNATRKGEEYTEQDYKVLSDPDLTILQKALRLKRTWGAVATVCSQAGYKSHVGLHTCECKRWAINNPNLGNVDDIREALEEEANYQRAKEIGPKLVEQWDWDD